MHPHTPSPMHSFLRFLSLFLTVVILLVGGAVLLVFAAYLDLLRAPALASVSLLGAGVASMLLGVSVVAYRTR